MRLTEDKLKEILVAHVPSNAVDQCYVLWEETPFNFIISKSRTSKFGDYKFSFLKKDHSISVNRDLNKYAFLVTFLHEVAHLRTNLRHGIKVKPHGEEWKKIFAGIAAPFLNLEVFPEDVLSAFRTYISNPKASSCSDPALIKTLRLYDDINDQISLSEVKPGEWFKLNSRVFVKEDTKRSRAICQEINTGRRYFVSEAALIELVGQAKLAFS